MVTRCFRVDNDGLFATEFSPVGAGRPRPGSVLLSFWGPSGKQGVAVPELSLACRYPFRRNGLPRAIFWDRMRNAVGPFCRKGPFCARWRTRRSRGPARQAGPTSLTAARRAVLVRPCLKSGMGTEGLSNYQRTAGERAGHSVRMTISAGAAESDEDFWPGAFERGTKNSPPADCLARAGRSERIPKRSSHTMD
jgi:hypothetical protein